MQGIVLDHKAKSILLKQDIVVKNDLIYELFNKTPQNKRNEILQKSLYIGALALIEDRVSAFLSTTKNELGTELERLKILFDMKVEIFSKSAVKGKYAERDLVKVLNDYFDEKEWKDYAILVGDVEGKLKRVKTGDITSYIDGKEDDVIVIEVKFAKSIPLGDISTTQLRNNTNNIWGQLLEAKVNRSGKEAIIVFDNSISPELYNKLGPATYIPNVGYIVFVDMQSSNYLSLFAVYSIVRSAVIAMKDIKIIKPAMYRKIIDFVLNRTENLLNIRKLVEANIKNNEKILKNIESNLKELEVSKDYLGKLIKDEFDSEDLLDFFTGKTG